jgi:hypothetical protein
MAGDDQKKPPTFGDELQGLDERLKRITTMPLGTEEQRTALLTTLTGLKQELDDSVRARPDAPGWRRSIDAALTVALDGIIGDFQRGSGAPAGQLRLDPAMLRRHLEPVFLELSEALQRNFVEKFSQPRPPGAPPIQVDGADVAAMLLTLFGAPKKK